MTQISIETEFKIKAQEELEAIRRNCNSSAVDDNVTQLRAYLKDGGLSLADIGTSEHELKWRLARGHRIAALNGPRLSVDVERMLEHMLGE